MSLEQIKSFEELILLSQDYADPEDLLQLLRDNGLVKRQGKRCCSRDMREARYSGGSQFGKVWRCTVCSKKVPTLKGSFFERSRLHPFTILKVAYAYLVNKVNYDGISVMVTGAPKSTNLTDWLQFCRDLLSKALLRETQGVKLGGPGKVVVVDETSLAKCKFLGMYDVEAKVGHVVWIEDRSHDSIIPQIEACVAEGSEILTPEMTVYQCLSDRGYRHRTVNHSREFVAADGTHINHIEAYFSRIKEYLRKRNTKSTKTIASYMDEWMWMERHRGDIWGAFIRALRRQYRC